MKIYFICGMLLTILISGCISADNTNNNLPEDSLNLSDCNSEFGASIDVLKNKIESLFGITSDEYVLNFVECSSKATYKAKGIIKNRFVFEYADDFQFSSSPSQRHEICFSIEPASDNGHFEIARNTTCVTLRSEFKCPPYNSSCGLVEYNKTSELVASCISGQFDQRISDKTVFSVNQYIEGSWTATIEETTEFSDFCK
jgi:hypothetical protein